MAVRGVLFDLFGTLVDYDPSRSQQGYPETFQLAKSLGTEFEYPAFLQCLDKVFADLDRWSLQHEEEFSMLQFADLLLAALGVASEQNTAESRRELCERYIREWMSAVEPIHGVTALLSRAAKQFKIGLITNTHYEPMIDQLIETHRLEGFSVVTASVSHGRPKPHPDIFLDTLNVLEIKPEKAVYVGDSYRNDYLGATAVGMQCYLVGRHARVPREYQIPTVLDLPLHLIR